MYKMRFLFALLTTLWLAACASSSPSSLTERYTLPSAPAVATDSKPTEHTLVLEGVQVARYLSGQGIVLQRDDVVLHQASSHLWAEDLNRQLTRGLRQRLANRLDATRVVSGGNDASALRLRVEVEQFQGRYDGLAVAAGRWQLRDAQGELLLHEAFNAEVALDQDGYPALVRALGRAWDEVAAQIATRIETLQ